MKRIALVAALLLLTACDKDPTAPPAKEEVCILDQVVNTRGDTIPVMTHCILV